MRRRDASHVATFEVAGAGGERGQGCNGVEWMRRRRVRIEIHARDGGGRGGKSCRDVGRLEKRIRRAICFGWEIRLRCAVEVIFCALSRRPRGNETILADFVVNRHSTNLLFTLRQPREPHIPMHLDHQHQSQCPLSHTYKASHPVQPTNQPTTPPVSSTKRHRKLTPPHYCKHGVESFSDVRSCGHTYRARLATAWRMCMPV
ncbi:uncharacterized protein IWZ02DRAFT_115381 [Phyllosticta citriasiana]|uniref:Uncharacterized protein n=1 Tax=Phyllosticta citriasiana TaxID=595635 RepID=A0ABR1KB37_9PEZI